MPRPAELAHATDDARQAAQRAAEILLEIEAVNFRPDDRKSVV